MEHPSTSRRSEEVQKPGDIMQSHEDRDKRKNKNKEQIELM